MADQYDRNAKQELVKFTDEIRKEILALAHSTCEEEGWRLEAAGFELGHTHLVISWRGFNRWEEVDRRLKNLLALKLNRRHDTPGKRWFVRGCSAPRWVEKQPHLKYLLETYLPDHPGIFWKRGASLPNF
jgi:hypothetical protein